MISLVFAGTILSKDNCKIMNKQGRFFLPMKFKVWEQEKVMQFLEQRSKIKELLPLKGDIEMALRFFFRDKRYPDLDNASKGINDAMNKHLYLDDKQIEIIHKYRYLDRENPRIEMDVWAIK